MRVIPAVRSGFRRIRRLMPVLAAAACLLAGAARAQEPAPPRPARADSAAAIGGRVVDAGTRQPLPNARIALQRLARAGGDSDVVRTTTTGPTGEYRFGRLPAGLYRVRAERIGYVGAASFEVELRSGAEATVSVGLQVDPVALPGVRVRSERTQLYRGSAQEGAQQLGARVRLAEDRQREHLAGDVRRLSHADVSEAVTLGETDLFRALQRAIPGVNTRDDFTATLWTRGATWDQTRVFFDGLPLFNPTHAGWLFSSINPDAVGDATFHPGIRPARWGEGAAAVLDVRSRAAGYGEGLRGSAELSVSSARIAGEGRLLDDNLGWVLSARRSYLDVVSSLAAGLGGNDELAVPYNFSDVVLRLDASPGPWRVEASGLLEYDHLRGDIDRVIRGNSGRWGNLAGQVAVERELGPVRARLMVGSTYFGTTIRRTGEDLPADTVAVTLPELRNAIDHRVVRLALAPGAGRGDAWDAGAELVWDSVAYRGPFELLPATVLRGFGSGQEQVLTGSLQRSALWGERRWRPLDRLELQTGLRWEFGAPVNNAGKHRLAPRLAARYRLDEPTTAWGGWTRSFQYVQDIAPIAGPVGPELHISSLWVLASGGPFGTPVVRADVFTGGLERWFGSDVLVGASAYTRWATGMRTPNPLAGLVDDPRRSDPATADNRAWGLELSAQKMSGRWTASANYSYGHSELYALVPVPGDTVFEQYPSSADVRHNLDASAMLRVAPGLQAGAAYTAVSGVPFTRLVITDQTAFVERANTARTPRYASLDLLLEYTRELGGWDLGMYVQLRNALGRNNRVTYEGSRIVCPQPAGQGALRVPTSCANAEVVDEFEGGLPRLPLVGIRVTF